LGEKQKTTDYTDKSQDYTDNDKTDNDEDDIIKVASEIFNGKIVD